jgi:hypothetical protein
MSHRNLGPAAAEAMRKRRLKKMSTVAVLQGPRPSIFEYGETRRTRRRRRQRALDDTVTYLD